jgi:hypothetical protein
MWHPNWPPASPAPDYTNSTGAGKQLSDNVDWAAAAQQWLKNREIYEQWQQQQWQMMASMATTSVHHHNQDMTEQASPKPPPPPPPPSLMANDNKPQMSSVNPANTMDMSVHHHQHHHNDLKDQSRWSPSHDKRQSNA